MLQRKRQYNKIIQGDRRDCGGEGAFISRGQKRPFDNVIFELRPRGNNGVSLHLRGKVGHSGKRSEGRSMRYTHFKKIRSHCRQNRGRKHGGPCDTLLDYIVTWKSK